MLLGVFKITYALTVDGKMPAQYNKTIEFNDNDNE